MATSDNQAEPAAGELESATGGHSPARRAEDAGIVLFGTDSSGAGIAADLGSFQPTPERLANAAFLIDLGGDEALVVPAADAHLLPRGAGGAELADRAVAMTQALRRERDWVSRRLRMPDSLMAYAERLQQAGTEADVYEALREVATPVIGAFTAVIYVTVGDTADAQFHPLADPDLRLPLEPLPLDTIMSFAGQRLITAAEVPAEPSGALAPVASILAVTGAAQLLCSPVATDALLVLVERRRQRVLTGEDLDLLAALVRQAEGALRRIVSERRVAELALKDPLTGLPAGRHVEIMVDHALGMARRGHPLAVLLVDLEHTEGEPGIPDREDALYWLASSFHEQLRRTDLALRQDANRFMVLLADTDAEGARQVVERIKRQAGGGLRLRTGVAVYGPDQDTADRLADAATEDLKGKQRAEE